MNKLSADERANILHLLCEGMSIRAITRLTGASKNTVSKLLADAGRACAIYQDQAFRELPCTRIQVDEIWSFVYAKAKNVETAKAAPEGAGDVWTWTALCADTKLLLSWLVGGRDAEYATVFMHDIRGRLLERPQITSDGHFAYLSAVDEAFGKEVDYAQIIKTYGESADSARRYSPPICTGVKKRTVHRQSRQGSRLYVVRGAPEPHDADAHAPLHAANERLLKEGGEPRSRHRAPCDVLQLRKGAARHSHDPGHEGGSDGYALDHRPHRARGGIV